MNGAGTHALHLGPPAIPGHQFSCVPVKVTSADHILACPYGAVGDRLWVKETWCLASPDHAEYGTDDGRPRSLEGRVAYYAAIDAGVEREDGQSPWCHPLFMPRWATRITLEITDVRVQRLQEISEDDARAEGARHWPDVPDPSPYGQGKRWSFAAPTSTDDCLGTARWAFASEWNDLHGRQGGKRHCDAWDENPFVWVISFRRVTP